MSKRPKRTPDPDPTGRYAYDGLERVMHERARLGILTSLATHAEGLLFNDLKELCALTDGNLSRHLQILQEAGFVSIRRRTGRGRPQTRCRLSVRGRKRFLAYLEELERVVSDAQQAAEEEDETGSEGWAPA